MRAGEIEGVVAAHHIVAGAPVGVPALAIQIDADGVEQFGRVFRSFAPQFFAGTGIEAGQIGAKAKQKNAFAVHTERAAVDRLFFMIMPLYSFAIGIDGEKIPAESPGILFLVKARRNGIPRPAVFLPFPAQGRIFDLLFADQGIEHAVLQPHPLPEGAVGPVRVHADLAGQLTGFGTIEFARFVIADIQVFRSGDHGVAMQHDAGHQVPLPQQRAVITVKGHQFVEIGFFSLMPGNAAEPFEQTSG